MSAWKDFVTAALIGTEKASPPELPSPLDAALAGIAEMDREMRFLTQAGAVALSRRVGWKPAQNEFQVPQAESETTKEISRASAAHLRAMLGGRHLLLLAEWLKETARLGQRVPPELLPALLDRAAQDRGLRPLALAAGGQRIHWLAAHRSNWTFAAAESPELWETGSRDQRVAILRALRAGAPEEARAKVEAVWKTEPADMRTAFVNELLSNLSEADAPFLEAALEDRSKEVRRAVIELLGRLPSSAFVGRMIERAKPLFVYKKGGILSRSSLEVTLPADPDPAGTRDGLDPKGFGQQKLLGEKAVMLVQIIASIPLHYWTEAFADSPEAILKAAGKNEFGRALATGWTSAAIRQNDALWAEALLDSKVHPHTELISSEPLFSLLPEAARIERLTAMLRGKIEGAAWHSVAGKLAAFPGYLPARLGLELLAALRIANGIPWHLRGIASSLLALLPPALLPEASKGWPLEKEGVSDLVEMLTFRHDALSALSQTP